MYASHETHISRYLYGCYIVNEFYSLQFSCICRFITNKYDTVSRETYEVAILLIAIWCIE
jgi:hypothetical protein